MTLNWARGWLASIFLGGLVFNTAAFVIAFAQGAIASEDLTAGVARVFVIYSVHLVIIVGSVFSEGQLSPKVRAPRVPLYLATVVAVTWNLVLLSRSAMLVFAVFDPARDDRASSLLSFWSTASDYSSFMVAAALTFFFTRNAIPSVRCRRSYGDVHQSCACGKTETLVSVLVGCTPDGGSSADTSICPTEQVRNQPDTA